MAERPVDMYPGDRLPDQVFEHWERFFYRVNPAMIQPDGKVDPAHVQCPNLSSNRSKFSQPHYVLYPIEVFGDYAVFNFSLDKLPPHVCSPDSIGGTPQQYEVRTVHDPEPNNYPHCETRLYRNGVQTQPNKVNGGAKKVFRFHMSEALQLERRAGTPIP